MFCSFGTKKLVFKGMSYMIIQFGSLQAYIIHKLK